MSAIEQIRKKRQEKTAVPEDLPLLFQALKEFAEKDEEVKSELELVEDMSVNFKTEDESVKLNLKLKSGVLEIRPGEIDEAADATIEMTRDVAQKIILGEAEAVREAYMAGELRIEGDMTKLLSLRPIFELARSKVGGEIKI